LPDCPAQTFYAAVIPRSNGAGRRRRQRAESSSRKAEGRRQKAAAESGRQEAEARKPRRKPRGRCTFVTPGASIEVSKHLRSSLRRVPGTRLFF